MRQKPREESVLESALAHRQIGNILANLLWEELMKINRLIVMAALLTFAGAGAALADNLQINLPYGIGSVQLPWQATEVGYGEFKPFKGGLWHQDLIASLPILTLGKLASGYRIIDGSLGAVAAIPSNGAVPDAYGALGHDLVQDIPILSTFKSLHSNVGVTYANAGGGWSWGGTISYAFLGS